MNSIGLNLVQIILQPIRFTQMLLGSLCIALNPGEFGPDYFATDQIHLNLVRIALQ